MICISKGKLKVRDADGTVREIPPGEIFEPKNPDQVRPLIGKGLVRVVQDTETIMRSARDEVIAIGSWQSSPETRQAEDDMEAAQHRGIIIDFWQAAQRWKKAGTG